MPRDPQAETNPRCLQCGARLSAHQQVATGFTPIYICPTSVFKDEKERETLYVKR